MWTTGAASHHEAGHAVAAYRVGIPFHYVTIVPDGYFSGHIDQKKWWSSIEQIPSKKLQSLNVYRNKAACGYRSRKF